MKAMQYTEYGDYTKLSAAEKEQPVPGAGELLVKVMASSVNPIDWKLYNGSLRYLIPANFPAIPGFDVAGVVAGIGADVSNFRLGDRVFACIDNRRGGAAAEYALVNEAVACALPSGLDFKSAAALPMAGLTALQALYDSGGLETGSRLLIIGASGGVGHFAVQIGKSMGAHVTAVCGTNNVEMVRDLGADVVIDYQIDDYLQSGSNYDLILDCIVSAPFSKISRILSYDGTYVVLLPDPRLFGQSLLNRLFSKQKIKLHLSKPNSKDLECLTQLYKDGKLRVIVDSEYTLAELPKAHAKSQQGHARGKIVINVQ